MLALSDGWLIACSRCWQDADGSPSCFSFIICSWWEVSAGMLISCYKLVLCQKLVSPQKHVSEWVCPCLSSLSVSSFASLVPTQRHNHKQMWYLLIWNSIQFYSNLIFKEKKMYLQMKMNKVMNVIHKLTQETFNGETKLFLLIVLLSFHGFLWYNIFNIPNAWPYVTIVITITFTLS